MVKRTESILECFVCQNDFFENLRNCKKWEDKKSYFVIENYFRKTSLPWFQIFYHLPILVLLTCFEYCVIFAYLSSFFIICSNSWRRKCYLFTMWEQIKLLTFPKQRASTNVWYSSSDANITTLPQISPYQDSKIPIGSRTIVGRLSRFMFVKGSSNDQKASVKIFKNKFYA